MRHKEARLKLLILREVGEGFASNFLVLFYILDSYNKYLR